MGFFSGIRRRIKKIIPKEIRPAVPFVAAYFGGPALAAKFQGLSPAMAKALIAGGTKFASDDEADLRDVARVSALAAAPDLVGEGLGSFADKYGAVGDTAQKATMLTRIADSARQGQQAIQGAGLLTTAGSQAATDFGIKQAELNEKALEEYNANLLSRGIRDKAE